MYVIAGKYKGRRLKVPLGSRPAKSIVKQAIFSILADDVLGSCVLDLYAGSGALGIEALSRGATQATFVDDDSAAVKVINDNLLGLGIREGIEVVRSDVLKFLGDCPDDYDLVFCDPPYNERSQHLFRVLPYALKPEGRVIFLHPSARKLDLGEDLVCLDQRRYGQTTVSILGNYRTSVGPTAS